ncbi:hypothetical protein [Nocardia asteroides]|uniref:hypothetical protein n=1 Tax=Nocardia asteroides TaxID=1824 RepID=UPI003419B3D2
MKDTRTHDEDGVITPEAKLSGNAYVVVRLRDSDDPPGRILLVRNPSRCPHGCTICAECAASWELDHHMHYESTGGGRWLRSVLDARPPATDSTDPIEADSEEPGTDAADSSPARASSPRLASTGPRRGRRREAPRLP